MVKALPAGEVRLRVIRPRDPTAVGRALAEQRWVWPAVASIIRCLRECRMYRMAGNFSGANFQENAEMP